MPSWRLIEIKQIKSSELCWVWLHAQVVLLGTTGQGGLLATDLEVRRLQRALQLLDGVVLATSSNGGGGGIRHWYIPNADIFSQARRIIPGLLDVIQIGLVGSQSQHTQQIRIDHFITSCL